jgi:hypothetical protein
MGAAAEAEGATVGAAAPSTRGFLAGGSLLPATFFVCVIVVVVVAVEVVEVDTTVEAAAAAANFLLISSLIDIVFLTDATGSFLVCVCGITSLLSEADARFGAPLPPPPPPAEPALFRLPPALFISQPKSHEIEKKENKKLSCPQTFRQIQIFTKHF